MSSIALYKRYGDNEIELPYHWAMLYMKNADEGTVYHCKGTPGHGMIKDKKSTREGNTIGLIYIYKLININEETIQRVWETTDILREDNCADFIIRMCKNLGVEINKKELENRANGNLENAELTGIVLEE